MGDGGQLEKLYFTGIPVVDALLAHPWCAWTPGSDNPPPVVVPRGLPADLSPPLEVKVRDRAPDICCATWLTFGEVEEVAQKHIELTGQNAPEIEAALGLMRAGKKHGETRLVVYYT